MGFNRRFSSDMRAKITVEVLATERTAGGGTKSAPTQIGPFNAEYIPQRGQEEVAGGQLSAQEMAVFKVLRHSGTASIKAKDVLIYQGKRFDIQSVIPWPSTTQKFLEMTCVARRVG